MECCTHRAGRRVRAVAALRGRVSLSFPYHQHTFQIWRGVLLYYDLRIRNEDYDLALRLAEMEEKVGRNAGERAP